MLTARRCEHSTKRYGRGKKGPRNRGEREGEVPVPRGESEERRWERRLPAGWLAEGRQDGGAPSGRPPLQVNRAASKISIDGALDEAAWQSAAQMELRYETRPAENAPPPVRTEVLFTYDSDHFYVAFRAHDPNPPEIAMSENETSV